MSMTDGENENGEWLSARARAKLNLFLEVPGKRPDGYHNIDSVFVEIDLGDTVQGRVVDGGGIRLRCDTPGLPTGEENLVVKAVRALRAACEARGIPGASAQGLELQLHKRIPVGGGLGGGSSDAAAALLLANELWGCGLGEEELLPLAATLGSDVPFFLRGGACRCTGRGDVLEPVASFPERIAFGLAIPSFPSLTADAYKNLRLPHPNETRSAQPFIKAMANGKMGAMRTHSFNRFEETVFQALPQLGKLHGELEALLRHPVRMSGSGSALWFFAEKGWRGDTRLNAWANANGVTLLSTRPAR